MSSHLGFVNAQMISANQMKQTVDVNDPESPRGSVNHSQTTLRSRADALPRNLIVVPCVGFTTAIVQRSRSSFSLCTSRSRADKLEVDQHHNRSITRREEEKNEEKNFLVFLF
jgi:hypothetical protein